MDNNEGKIKNPGNGRELFYIVITIAIFIVMAVGATFAFFTATTQSGDTDVGTRSATLSLEYISYGSAWSRDDLIPADREVSEYSVEFQDDTTFGTNTAGDNNAPLTDKENNTICKDDYGNSICSIYEFQIKNPADSPQTVNIDLVTESNGFGNLNAMAYEVSVGNSETYGDITNATTAGNNGFGDPIFKANAEDLTEGAIQVTDGNSDNVYDETPIYINREGVTKTLLQYERSPEDTTENLAPSINRAVSTEFNGHVTLANNVVIDRRETKTFIIVLYVLNKKNDQGQEVDQTTEDANKTFSGSVLVGNGSGTGGVSGRISASGSATLQGDQTQGGP